MDDLCENLHQQAQKGFLCVVQIFSLSKILLFYFKLRAQCKRFAFQISSFIIYMASLWILETADK